jgi:hypothetical protein
MRRRGLRHDGPRRAACAATALALSWLLAAPAGAVEVPLALETGSSVNNGSALALGTTQGPYPAETEFLVDVEVDGETNPVDGTVVFGAVWFPDVEFVLSDRFEFDLLDEFNQPTDTFALTLVGNGDDTWDLNPDLNDPELRIRVTQFSGELPVANKIENVPLTTGSVLIPTCGSTEPTLIEGAPLEGQRVDLVGGICIGDLGGIGFNQVFEIRLVGGLPVPEPPANALAGAALLSVLALSRRRPRPA